MANPRQVRLKDEVEQKRTRTELIHAADAATVASPESFAAEISKYFDLDRYITYYAVEASTSNYDGFSFNVNNAYLYTHPKDGRLITIPYGADSSFWAEARITKIRSPFQPARSTLPRRVQAIPELAQKFAAEVARVGSPPIWDKKVLLDRLAQVEQILATAPTSGRSADDVRRFAAYRPTIEAFINAGVNADARAALP